MSEMCVHKWGEIIHENFNKICTECKQLKMEINLSDDPTEDQIINLISYHEGWKDAKVHSGLDLARSAPETTEILNEVKADKGILTEEELKEYENRRFDFGNWPIVNDLEAFIKSHRNLLSANAELSFKNNKYREALNSILEGDWGRSMDEDGLATHFTDRIDPHKIAKEALEETK